MRCPLEFEAMFDAYELTGKDMASMTKLKPLPAFSIVNFPLVEITSSVELQQFPDTGEIAGMSTY